MVTGIRLKQFFKKHFGIPVLARAGKKWCNVCIAPIYDREPGWSTRPMRFSHTFPAELGNRCMRIVYPNSESLSAQNWGGNIGSTSLAMHPAQWEQLIAQYEPATVG